jgi:hypothetical protein
VHVPVQHAVLLVHASPGCTQNDEGWHVPVRQRPEQHSEGCAHGLPSVWHVGFSVPQAPAVHVPLQHCVPVVHPAPSAVHAGTVQKPFAQSPEQQSAAVPHAAPRPRQTPPLDDPPLPPPLLLPAPLLLVLPPLPLLLVPPLPLPLPPLLAPSAWGPSPKPGTSPAASCDVPLDEPPPSGSVPSGLPPSSPPLPLPPLLPHAPNAQATAQKLTTRRHRRTRALAARAAEGRARSPGIIEHQATPVRAPVRTGPSRARQSLPVTSNGNLSIPPIWPLSTPPLAKVWSQRP